MSTGFPEAGDTLPPACEVIEVRISELRQIFNEIDPSPFHERDLAPEAEEFIVDWAREIPAGASIGLMVSLHRPPGPPGEATGLREAVHQFFGRREQRSRRRLRELFSQGRVSLLIGLGFLTATSALANLVGDRAAIGSLDLVLRESLLIGGWVAMWRPLEVFLYDWWPIRAEAKRYLRLAAMPVRIRYTQSGPAESGRRDGPAVPPGSRPTPPETSRT